MKRLAFVVIALLAGCAVTPQAPPGTVLKAPNADQAVQPGVTTKAQLLAQLGSTTSIRFDSGVEVWRYLTPGAGGHYGEFVVVIDPRGVVSRTRRADLVYQWPPQK